MFNKDSFECTFCEIKRKMKSYLIIGSIYQPPNTKPKEFNDQYQLMMNTLKKENTQEIILGMDHNLDLLKANSHSETQHFIDITLSNNILPCITRPTRITKSTATLTDNIFISQKLHRSFDSCVIINDISYHLPSMVNIHDQGNNNNEPLEFKCRSLNKKQNGRKINKHAANYQLVNTK